MICEISLMFGCEVVCEAGMRERSKRSWRKQEKKGKGAAKDKHNI